MPTTEEATVMTMLSTMPAQISPQRLTNPGWVKDMMKAAPRSSPS
jgi:hypothetical protein